MNDLISRQALCEYALNQKDKSVTPNDIMRFPSAQPVATDTNVGDTISRKGVFIPNITVEMFRNASLVGVEDLMVSGEMEDISLPSVQPEQKTGHWIILDSDSERCEDIKCPFCGHTFTVDAWRWCDIGFIKEDFNFCPNCGAHMKGGTT